MNILLAIVTALIIGALAPFISFATSGLLEAGRRGRAYQRIKNEPTIYKGVKLTRLECTGHHGPLMGPCLIVDIQVGRIVVENIERTEQMTFTGRELEALHPVVDISTQKNTYR